MFQVSFCRRQESSVLLQPADGFRRMESRRRGAICRFVGLLKTLWHQGLPGENIPPNRVANVAKLLNLCKNGEGSLRAPRYFHQSRFVRERTGQVLLGDTFPGGISPDPGQTGSAACFIRRRTPWISVLFHALDLLRQSQGLLRLIFPGIPADSRDTALQSCRSPFIM